MRKAKQEDIPQIIKFQQQMAQETEDLTLVDQKIKKGVEAVFNDPEKGFYIVATSNSQTVASMMITPEWSDWRNGYFLWIQSLYVIPTFRKQGVFRNMYQYIKQTVVETANYLGLRLYVEENNNTAIDVYLNVGMKGSHYKMFEWIDEFD
ncbi:MAG: GNAT family N-acetyltransferase [Bacteroidales bacterium]|nr:GNAT family N-acetyltransferase [Bacteroidales bacterium]